MLNALAFGLGVGAAIQAWRVWPPGGPLTANALALVFCVGLVCAWFGGRSRRSPSAVAFASAEATATAVNSVQVAVFTGRDERPEAVEAFPSAGVVDPTRQGVRVPSESARWLGPPVRGGQLEHLDVEEIRSILEESTETHDV